jgi:hypothetical protein
LENIKYTIPIMPVSQLARLLLTLS